LQNPSIFHASVNRMHRVNSGPDQHRFEPWLVTVRWTSIVDPMEGQGLRDETTELTSNSKIHFQIFPAFTHPKHLKNFLPIQVGSWHQLGTPWNSTSEPQIDTSHPMLLSLLSMLRHPADSLCQDLAAIVALSEYALHLVSRSGLVFVSTMLKQSLFLTSHCSLSTLFDHLPCTKAG